MGDRDGAQGQGLTSDETVEDSGEAKIFRCIQIHRCRHNTVIRYIHVPILVFED